MKNITPKLSIAMILLSTILFSCKEETPLYNEQLAQRSSSATYTANPVEWCGGMHNELFDSLSNNINLNNWDSTWVDTSFVEYVLLHPTAEFSSYSPQVINMAREYLYFLGDYDSLINKFTEEISNASHITDKEKSYVLRMVEFSIKALSSDSVANAQEVLDSINSIESDILSEYWEEDEVFALFSISMMKYSYAMHINNSLEGIRYNYVEKNLAFNHKRHNKQYNQLLRIRLIGNKTMAGVCGLADWTVGAGVFLGATGSTGGLGVGAGLYAGVKAGGIASSVVAGIGAYFDWWDIDIFG